jgi:PAS domain S-box-containing protein
MNDSLPKLEEQYTHALEDYLGGAGEVALQRAYELGRQAIDNRMGVLDMALVHREALSNILAHVSAPEKSAEATRQAQAFFTESLSAFEMAQRGFQEAILKLHSLNETLEQQVADRTRELREANQTLQALIQASPLAIVVLDLQKKVKLWNPAAERLYGWTAPEVLNQPYPIVPHDQAAEFEALHETVLKGISITGVELERRQKDGRKIFISLSAAPLYDPQGQANQAILLAEDITERRRAERAQRLLAEAGHLFAASLDYSATLTGLAQLLVPKVADWCSIDLVEEGTLRQRIIAHANPDKLNWVQELLQRYPLNPQATHGAPNVIRTGVAEIYAEVGETDTAEAIGPDSSEAKIARELGVTSALIVPLTARGRTFGALTLVWSESGQHYTPADLALAEELARRTALVIDNSRLYAESQKLNAELEQRVMERTTELQIANLELSAEITERKEAQAEVQRQAARLQALVQSAARLNAQLNLEAVIQAVCEETVLALNVPLATVSLYASERQLLYYAGGVGLPYEYEHNVQPISLAEDEARVGQGPLIVTPDVLALPDLPNAEMYQKLNVRTTINVSMWREGQLIGRLNIGTVGAPREFTEDELALLRGLAEQAAQAIINARLFEAVQKELSIRQKVETALLKSEAQYRNIVDTAQEGIWLLDAEDRTSFVNQRLAEMLGRQVEEMLGRPVFDFMDEALHKEAHAHLERRRQGAREHYDFRFRRKDGTDLWTIISANPVLDPDGRYLGALKMVADITERKRAESRVRESERTLAEAQQIAHLGNWRWDIPTGRLTWSNEMYRIYGVDPQKFNTTYDAYLDRIHPDDREYVRRLMDQAYTDHAPFAFEHRLLRPDGTSRVLYAQGRVVLDPVGLPNYMIGTALDITERKQIETELEKSREQLRALSAHLQSVREQERTSIAREIHDELSQALTGLKMDLSWLQRNMDTDRKAFQKKLRSMTKLMDETIQTGRRISAELRPGALDDLGLAAAIEWQMQEFQERTGIRCKLNSTVGEELDLGPEGSTAMFRIFQETISNVARHAQASRVQISLTEAEGYLILKVQDNGRGITQAEMEHPQSFGLIGMQERIHLLAGEIKLEGSPGKGTTVTVTVPLNQPTSLAPLSPAAEPSTGLPSSSPPLETGDQAAP